MLLIDTGTHLCSSSDFIGETIRGSLCNCTTATFTNRTGQSQLALTSTQVASLCFPRKEGKGRHQDVHHFYIVVKHVSQPLKAAVTLSLSQSYSNISKACWSARINPCLVKKKKKKNKASLYPPPENALSSGQAPPREMQYCKRNVGHFLIPLNGQIPFLSEFSCEYPCFIQHKIAVCQLSVNRVPQYCTCTHINIKYCKQQIFLLVTKSDIPQSLIHNGNG